MPLHYFHAERLGLLFPALHEAVRRERQKLMPQKTQAIVIGNLETEAWLTHRFLVDDGVLMGVRFPFLESAISSFTQRLELQLAPTDSESWFLPPAGDQPRPLGRAEFELLLLGILNDPSNNNLLQELGYRTEKLMPTQVTTLATVLANELHETILHRPTLLDEIGKNMRPAKTAGERLWLCLYRALKSTGRPFPAYEPGLSSKIAQLSLPAGSVSETLYLFGMPILSEYHLRCIAAIARHVSVHLYMTDLSTYASNDNNLLALAGKKAKAFVSLLREVSISYGVEFVPRKIQAQPEPGKTVAIYALPGIWRAAELMGDEFHALLRHNPQLYQDDIGVSLTNPSMQYAAFERALAMRQLVAFSRERFYEVQHPLAELWQIIADAVQTGISRPLIVRYALNPLVAEKYSLEPKNIQQWLTAIDNAHGYRNDYLDSQAVFGLEAALRRIERGVIIRNSEYADLPAAYPLRQFDSREFAEGLHAFLQPLLTARSRLTDRTGSKLAAEMLTLQQEISGASESLQTLAAWFDQMSVLQGFSTLSLSHVVKLLQYYLPGNNLVQRSSREGITFSSLAASCYTRDTQLLFDLSEDADRQDRPAEYLFPEMQTATTRFTASEQLAIQLATALCSDCRQIILAYCANDPATGADKYPSQALSEVHEAAKILGRTVTESRNFSPGLLSCDANLTPIAADADRRTQWLLQQPRTNFPPLSAFTLPKLAADFPLAATEIRDLLAYLKNPAYQVLRPHMPPDIAIAEFSRDEPKLAFSNDARLRFCEEYLELVLFDATGITQATASDFVRCKQARGEYPPEGFDQACRLLAEGNNDRRLSDLAIQLRNEFTLVEYIFHAGVNKPFAVEETVRLTRLYYPAIRVHKTRITGSSGILLKNSDGRLFRLQSAIYGERNARLVELYLLLCLFTLGDVQLSNWEITLADLATANNSKDPICAIEFTPRSTLPLPDSAAAKHYLKRLLAHLSEQHIALYDHAMIPSPVLSRWAGMPKEEILNRLHKYLEGDPKKEIRFLQQFYGLEVDSGSVNFFDAFIRPVALLDYAENPTKAQADTNSGKTSRKKAAKP